MLALDADVAGQSAQPFRHEPAPHHQPNERGDHADDHNEFSQVAHQFEKLRELSGGTSLRAMPVQFRDYYETLGVSKTATEEEIRSAFRKLARKYHPDVAKDKKAAEEKFKEINEAYEVLGDPEKRKKYDQLGADWNRPGGFQPPPGWHGKGSNPAAGFINGAAMVAALNSNSAGPGSAISSKHFSAADVVARLSADLADVRRRRSVEPMSKPTSWSRWKKRCTVPPEQFRCGGLARTKLKIIR